MEFNIEGLSGLKNDIGIANAEVTDRLIVKSIPIKELKESENNFYSISGIEELAEEIRVNGLLNPIKASKDNVILSGHRRLAAYKLLSNDNDKYNFIDTIYIDDFDSEEQKQLFLITENSNRIKTKEDISTEMSQKKELYTKLKNQGDEKYRNANITKILSQEYGVSEATIKRSTLGTSQNKVKTPNEEFNKKVRTLAKYLEKNSDEINVSEDFYNMIIDYASEI